MNNGTTWYVIMNSMYYNKSWTNGENPPLFRCPSSEYKTSTGAFPKWGYGGNCTPLPTLATMINSNSVRRPSKFMVLLDAVGTSEPPYYVLPIGASSANFPGFRHVNNKVCTLVFDGHADSKTSLPTWANNSDPSWDYRK